MSELSNIQRIYFIGIGGIGMSAIARYFLSRSVAVSGYDRTPTALSKALEEEGMQIHYDDDISLLDKEVNLVVYTPAVPKQHAELNWYRDNGYEVVKRSDVLQIITKNSFNICIGGTHGKTSISTMTGHILRHTGYGCNVFLGGISVNYNTNFWSGNNNVCVVEADEYDRSFLKLDPDIAVITSMDADHLDIYGTVEAMQEAFVAFASKIRPGGWLIRKTGLEMLKHVQESRQLTYNLVVETSPQDADDYKAPDVYAFNIKPGDGGYLFDAKINHINLHDIQLNVGGTHNIENMLAAITIAKALEIEDERIKEAVAAYQGVKRRFEYVIKNIQENTRLVFIDDYAHHPAELRALISSARELFPLLKCTVIFQPHLYTRTRDLAEGFADALDLAHTVLLLPIYPARELPIEGVSSDIIAKQMKRAKVIQLEKHECVNEINNPDTELLITAGAGDIDTLVPMLAKKLTGGLAH